jgi:ferric-dicitrate binding protein FerR (iron transport regulator)
MSSETRDDEIATLLRLAGPRPRVSDERAARVRDAVRDEWSATVRRRGRIRYASLAAALVITIAGAWVAYRATRVTPVAPIVIAGPATRNWRGVSLRLAADARIHFASDDAVVLERGTIYFDGRNARREVRTPFGSIRDVGTQFEAHLTADSLRIRVREGQVEFNGGTIDVGNEVLALRDGAIQRHPIARGGDAWTWAESAAPPIRLEGLTLRDVVQRVAREKGLAFDDDIPNGGARLHGDVPLSPSEALDAATAASGVAWSIRDERLILTRR